MSCNAIQLRTSEILNSTFRSRVFELSIPADNRNPANDVFTAKVKIKGTEILEIPGNIVGNRVIFQLTELEDTNKFTDYEIDYWANLDALGKELFAQEDLRVASKVQPDRCTPDVVAGTLNFGDVVVQAQVTMPVLVLEQHTNNYLDYDSLTPEQKEELEGRPGDQGPIGPEGLGIFYTSQQISGTNGSTALSNIKRPEGRNVKVGDLIISTNALSSGRLNIVTSLTATHANNSFLVNLRGIEGLSMYSANIAFDAVSGTLTKSEVNVPSGYSLKTADLVISTHPDTLLRLVRITSMTTTTANYTTVIENAITVEGETIEVGKNLTKVGNIVDVKIEANSISEAIPVNHNNAISITTDRFGNSYVIDFSQNNVSVTDTSGNSSILGNTGAGPRAVAVDDLGNVYTVNINDKNITKITPEGVTTILASFAAISGFIALDPDGNVYTINPSREVLKVTPGGTVSTLGVVGFGPMGIALDLSGNIYTPNAGSNSVSKITPAGTVSTIASVTFARGIATDKLGNVFTASWTENTLFKITPAGVKTTLTNLLDAPSLLAIHNDIVYVGSENNGKIFKVYPNGDTELMANLAGNSQGIDVDFAGNLYVLNGMPRTIIKFPAPNRRKLALNANDEIIRVGSYSLAEEFTGDMWINGKEIFRKVIVDGAAYPADIDALIREQTVGGHVILEYTKN